MDIEIVLDSRENHLKPILTNNNILFSIEQLAVGDIIFKNSSGQLILICERKTLTDLYSSICTGRYSEQRNRLLQTNVKICYIIENKNQILERNNDNSNDKKMNVVTGALVNLVLYHNILVIPTVSLEHTAKVIQSIQTKLKEKSMTASELVDGTLPTTNTITNITRKNGIHENMLVHQLNLINGVSIDIATKIVQVYPTINSLLNIYYKSELTIAEKENLLSNIKLGKRKLGAVLSQRIYKTFCC